ncbi:hypothetical protein [Actinocorallia libanotica]
MHRGVRDWPQHLLSWAYCQPLLADYCTEAGPPDTAAAFVTH